MPGHVSKEKIRKTQDDRPEGSESPCVIDQIRYSFYNVLFLSNLRSNTATARKHHEEINAEHLQH